MNQGRLLWALLSVLLLVSPAVADTILLKNGRKLEGEILGEEKGQILISIGGAGILRVEKEDIERIIDNDRDGSEYIESQKREETTVVDEEKKKEESKEKEGKEGKEEEGKDKEIEGWTLPKIKKELSNNPDVADEIKAHMQNLGIQSLRIRGRNLSAQRRQAAKNGLKEIGILALPALTEELNKNVRELGARNAAELIAGLANPDDIAAFVETVPVLLEALEFTDQETRKHAATALSKLTEKDISFPRSASGAISDEQREAINKWQEWWKDVGEAYFKELKEKTEG